MEELIEDVVALMIPIGICVVVPIAIIWIIFRASMNSENKRAEVLMEAIRSNNAIDADRLAKAMTKKPKTPRELLNLRLLRGCIFSLIGAAFLIIGLVVFLSGSTESQDPVLVPTVLGSISLAIGASYLIVYFVSKKQPEERQVEE